jgi:hypothetical protein
MDKKAQITLFVILGLVILIIFVALFWIKSYVSEEKFLEEKEEVEGLFSKQGKYYGYVSSCVQQSAKSALVLAGTQGGVIYETQAPGTKKYRGPSDYSYGQYILPFPYDDVYSLSDEDEYVYEVSYAIFRPDLSLGLEAHPSVPEYPFGNQLLVSDPIEQGPMYAMYVNPFGNILTNPLDPLCDYHGENQPGKEGAKYTCETYDSRRETDTDSIQEYLEAYIAYNTKECVNFDSMPEIANSSIEKGNVTASVIFTQDSVHVSVNFPINLKRGDESNTISMQSYETSLSVRFKKIHELFTRLVDREINDIFFDIQRDADQLGDCKEFVDAGVNVPCFREGMEIYKIVDVCPEELCNSFDGSFYPGRYDDVIIIEDSLSKIDGLPFMFFIAIQNRVPALDYIHEIPDDSYGTDYDYVVNAGDEIVIDPFGYDPDEDFHLTEGYMEGTYTYAHWKEDWDDIYDAVQCASAASYEDLIACRDYNNNPADPRFSTSVEYLDDSRSASLITDEFDIGPHELLLELCDNEGRCDRQVIDVLVLKDPYLVGYNSYEDVDDIYVSVEDPYFIQDFSTIFGGIFAQSYAWETTLPNVIKSSASGEEITFPEDLDLGFSSTIENIDGAMTILQSHVGDTLELKLTKEYLLRPPGTSYLDFTVVQCLPHRSSSPPYPYHDVGVDPFDANHACCNDNTHYEDPGTLCYEGTYYECDMNVGGDGGTLNTYEITDECSGTRGNICGDEDGVPASESSPVSLACGDCSTCDATSGSCVPLADGTSCGLTPGCDGNYHVGVGGTCQGGECDSTDRECDITCGAECLAGDTHEYDGTYCNYICDDCMYQYHEEYQPGDFWDQEFCYFNADCTENGITFDTKKQCLPGGETYDDPSDNDELDKCFSLDNDPCDTWLNSCDTEHFFPEDCIEGNPGAGDNFCLVDSEICIHKSTGLCTDNGWDWEEESIACDYGGGDEHFCLDNGGDECFYGVYCTSGGFTSTSEFCPETTYGLDELLALDKEDPCYYKDYGVAEGRDEDCAEDGCKVKECTIHGPDTEQFHCKRPISPSDTGCYEII